jgi:S1-C subfamily serine protease
VSQVRPSAVAAISLVSAVVGAFAVLLVGSAGGWLGNDGTETVVQFQDSPDGAARQVARPLPGNGFDPAQIYAERSSGVVTIYAFFGSSDEEAQGSGFVVSPEGHLLTNSHVITNAGEGRSGADVSPADEVFVEFKDGERVPARIVGYDLFDDIGVLQVDPDRHPVTALPLGDSSRVVVGEPVAAIGSPFGAENSLAVGVVSATRRSISALTSDFRLVDAIQTDAPINRGNSGGPLIDARGRVIGVNAQIRSESGTAEGVGFAVPINSAKRSLEALIENGRVEYAYVGISTDDLTPSLARELGLDADRGALVVDVSAGSPAQRAGLRGGSQTVEFNGRRVRTGGDVVLAIGGRAVGSGDDLIRIVTEELVPGQRVAFTVLRGSERLRIPVTLVERPLEPSE